MPFDPISLVVYAGLALASQALAARANRKKIKDVELPTDEPHRKIPYVAGTAKIAPHVIWWGDFKRSSVRTEFATWLNILAPVTAILDQIPFGYRYYIGMALGLCHGPGVRLRQLEAADHVVFSGTVTGGSFTVAKPGEFGAEGGLYAVCDYVPGTMAQLRNPYLNSQVADVPAFRGTATIYWRGPSSGDPALGKIKHSGYIGRSTVVKPMLATVDRFPDNLGVSEFSVIRNVHANFAEVIFELLTDPTVGLGLTTNFVDADKFAAAAETLFDEDLGCSFVWTEPTEIIDIIVRLLETIEGVLYSSLDTGKIILELVRPVDPAGLPLITDKQQGIEFELEISDPNNSVGEVRIPYFDVEKNTEATGLAQSITNRTRNGASTSVTIELLGIGDADAANRAATREWAQLVEPPNRGTLRTNRELYNFTVGSGFRLSWEPYRIEEEVWRVLEIDHGTLDNGMIEMKVAQDRAPSEDPELGAVTSTVWADPITITPSDDGVRTVQSMTTTAPPGSPAVGDRYIVPAGATGAWAGHTNEIATWNGSEWIFEPTDDLELAAVLNNADGKIYYWDGDSWEEAITSAYHTIQDEGVDLPRREKLNFIGAGVTVEDDEDNERTNVTIAVSTSEVSGLYDDIVVDPTTFLIAIDPVTLNVISSEA